MIHHDHYQHLAMQLQTLDVTIRERQRKTLVPPSSVLPNYSGRQLPRNAEALRDLTKKMGFIYKRAAQAYANAHEFPFTDLCHKSVLALRSAGLMYENLRAKVAEHELALRQGDHAHPYPGYDLTGLVDAMNKIVMQAIEVQDFANACHEEAWRRQNPDKLYQKQKQYNTVERVLPVIRNQMTQADNWADRFLDG